MQKENKRLLTLSIVTFFSLQIFQLAHAEGFRSTGSNGSLYFMPDEMIGVKYDLCQETEWWKKSTNPNFPLKLIDGQLIFNLSSRDKYMDKQIIGTAKNNSKNKFSEVKIEFIAYDEDGGQIGIVASHIYDFKSDGIWKFEIPVTSDVAKAKFNGFYVPLRELKNSMGKDY
jgi:hypothetical protein